jgi:hypothetical protein
MKPGLSSPMVLSMCLPERSVTSLPAAVAWFISCISLPSSQIAERPTLTKDGMQFPKTRTYLENRFACGHRARLGGDDLSVCRPQRRRHLAADTLTLLTRTTHVRDLRLRGVKST